jgi:hypothetical protein
MNFKDEHREFQFMMLEFARLRRHNLASIGRDERTLFMFGEGILIIVATERFLRMILPVTEIEEKDTLPNLLEKASGKRLNLVVLPGDRQDVISRAKTIRNTILHGNFEQAAAHRNLSGMRDYFKSSAYVQDVEFIFRLLNRIICQVDSETGKVLPRNLPELQRFLSSPAFLDLSQANGDEATDTSGPRLVDEA